MLVLTRGVGERVMIGNDIAVSIESVQGYQVRVGIAAPKRISVHRQEVYERIRAESQTSATSEDHDQTS